MGKGTWVTRGFEAFRRGTFGNGGQNIYVSRKGILQRIHLFDLDKDGFLDLVFANAQEHWESPPAYLYTDPMHSQARIELPAEGAVSAAVGDLNGDGCDELLLGMQYNGATMDLNARLYWGSPENLGEKYHTRLPAPRCTSVAIGDFSGNGKPDLAMVVKGKLRIYYQTKLGFEPKRFVDLDIDCRQIAAGDLDEDGFCDLYVLSQNNPPRVFWGSKEGLSAGSYSVLPSEKADSEAKLDEFGQLAEAMGIGEVHPLACVLKLGQRNHLFVPGDKTAKLFPVTKDRTFGIPLVFDLPQSMAARVGDLTGEGTEDLVFASRNENKQGGYVYWASPSGYSESRRTFLPGPYACDLAVGDLDGDGKDEIILCIHRSDTEYSVDSLIYRSGEQKRIIDPQPIHLPTHGARRVVIAHPTGDKPQVIFANQFARHALGQVDIAIYHGNKDGFSPDRCTKLPALGAAATLGCDINDDGNADLVVVNCAENALHLDHGSYIYWGSEKGFSKDRKSILPTRTPMAVVVADINRDGYLDLIFAAFKHNELLIFYGTEKGLDIEHPQKIILRDGQKEYKNGRRMCLADLNNDGWLDLVLTDCDGDRAFILWGSEKGFSFDRRQELSVVRSSCPQVADLSGNGYLDLIIGGHTSRDCSSPPESFVHIYWNGPDGLREDRRTQLPANSVLGIAAADLNNDGRLDLAVTSYHDGRERDIDSYIYWAKEDGTFSEGNRTLLRTHSASGIIAADFNEDGWIDLAIANHKVLGDHLGYSTVWWNSRDGFDPKNTSKLPTSGPHGMMHINPGNQRDRGSEEFYVSQPCELAEGAQVTGISWKAQLAPKTWVKAQVRCANSPKVLEETPWSEWLEQPGQPAVLPGRWVQYQLALGATNSGNTPRVSEVRIDYDIVD